MAINNQIQSIVADMLGDLRTEVEAEVAKRIATIEIDSIVNAVIQTKLEALIRLPNFPEQSIPHNSIKFENFSLTGNQVKGGIIENFGSTGIEDLATAVRMTLMDHAVVFEGPMYAPSAEIKGNLVVDGDLVVKGTVPTDSNLFTSLVEHSVVKVRESLNTELFAGFSELVSKQLSDSGLNLDKIKQGGREVIKGNQLGYHIIDSNLQRVGTLRDLQTVGENLLSNTLYVTEKRVGVNTIDPSSALAVWDEEVEVTVSKRKQDTAYVGTPRRQTLVLGSNSKENIVLDPEGSTRIDNLVIGKISMTSASSVPNYEGQAGQVVWNEQPSLGGPMGWVCLGATRWANFGIID